MFLKTMWQREQKEIGPSPLPAHLYAQRQLPVQRALFWLGRSAIALGMAGLVLAVFIVSLYRIPDGRGLLYWFSDRLPLPAMKVNDQTVPLREYRTVLDGWHQLYTYHGASEEQADEVVALRVDERMIRDVLLQELVRERGMTLNEEFVATVFAEFVAQYPTEAHFIEAIDRQFGWSPEQFSQLIVEPLARTRLLADSVGSWSEVQKQTLEIMQELHARIFIDTDSSSEIAQEVSTSLSASDGGELGLRPIDEYPIEARDILLSLDGGSLTSVIELPERFVIYQVQNQVERSSGMLVDAREVSVDKRDIYDVLEERMDSAEIEYYLK